MDRPEIGFISITRLRLRSIRFVPLFVPHTWFSIRQVRASDGFAGGSLLADRRWTFWTMTGWESADAMRRFLRSGAHKKAMPRLAGWCDEASVVHWDSVAAALPEWDEADRRMRTEGRASPLRHPSADHAALRFARPRLAGAVPIRRA